MNEIQNPAPCPSFVLKHIFSDRHLLSDSTCRCATPERYARPHPFLMTVSTSARCVRRAVPCGCAQTPPQPLLDEQRARFRVPIVRPAVLAETFKLLLVPATSRSHKIQSIKKVRPFPQAAVKSTSIASPSGHPAVWGAFVRVTVLASSRKAPRDPPDPFNVLGELGACRVGVGEEVDEVRGALPTYHHLPTQLLQASDPVWRPLAVWFTINRRLSPCSTRGRHRPHA